MNGGNGVTGAGWEGNPAAPPGGVPAGLERRVRRRAGGEPFRPAVTPLPDPLRTVRELVLPGSPSFSLSFLAIDDDNLEGRCRAIGAAQPRAGAGQRPPEAQRERAPFRETTMEISLNDPLTGLADRRLLFLQLERGIASAKRHCAPFSIVMVDIDHFKRYNDAHGHPAGDRLLEQVAALLTRAVRDTDLLFRMGGEEFLILLPRTGPAGVAGGAERLRRLLEESSEVTASFGAACYAPGIDIEQLLARADAALRRAKEMGGNRVELADPGKASA